jgi:hypothetical protein
MKGTQEVLVNTPLAPRLITKIVKQIDIMATTENRAELIDWILENVTADWSDDPKYTQEELEEKSGYDLLKIWLEWEGICGYTGKIVEVVQQAYDVDLTERKWITDEVPRAKGERHIQVQMAIMSHLSDAQEMNSVGMGDFGHNHINFAKQLVLTYPDTSVEVSEKELNELWRKTIS